MSIKHDSPAYTARWAREHGGPVAHGRAVPLREKGLVYERCPCAGFMAVYADGDAPNGMMDAKCSCGDWAYRYPAPYPAQEAAGSSQAPGGKLPTAQPPQAAHAPPAAPETGVADPIVARVCAPEPPRTGGYLDAPERPYRVFRYGGRVCVEVTQQPMSLSDATDLIARLLEVTGRMHAATLPKERI